MVLHAFAPSRRFPWWLRRAPRPRASLSAVAALALAAGAAAQAPLFTIVQTSDPQAGNETEWQRFQDVLALIANAGKPGALLPRPIDLVLFAGDITEGNENAEWVRARGMFDTWLTANGIPLLCVPGNRDQGDSAGSAQLYQQYIGSAGVWEAGSASFTGQNGIARNTGWSGLRIIGFNNSNGGWNNVSPADHVLIQSRVSAAAAASENVFLLAHHPHGGQSVMPLASVLTEPAIVGYMRGHSSSPKAQKGLSGIVNPNVWELNTNAIVDDRGVIYYEVFQTEIRAYVVVLDNNPTQLPSPKTIRLVFPLRQAGAPNIGFQGGSHAGARPWPSGSAPEKKLWFQDGNWFGVLWREASLAYRIFRLDTSNQTWVDTGTSVSATSGRSFDALASGTKLYLAAHFQSVPSAPGSGSDGQVSRYSYDSTTRTYSQDAGFPVTLNGLRTESLVLAKDTTGTLWATWTSGGDVLVTRTLNGNDATWSAPELLPFPSASGLDPEDVSALVAFDGKVALLWTDRIAGEIACAVRADGSAATSWVLESALLAPGAVSDTLDVATSSGRIYVATSTPGGVLRLLRRELGAAGLGSWSLHTVADAAAALSQPIVLIDETQSLVRLFAAGASPTGGSALGGGVIYEKDAPLASLAFPPGRGTVVIQDGQNFALGRASSTRQALSASTGLVVLASNELSQRSWHAFKSLGSAPLVPSADFSGLPRSGTAPLLVHFTDLSSGAPTSWLWTFGDGSTSTSANPDHVYAQPGAYAVSLRASNSAGSNQLSRSAYVNVAAPSGAVTLTPVADTTANEQLKTTNHGANATVRVRNQTGATFRTFLKFDLTGVVGTITSAKLRLFVMDASENGGSVYPITSSWSETGLTWNAQPSLPPASIASLGAVTAGMWKEVDVTAGVSGTGLVSLALSGGSTNLAVFTSREGSVATRPQLVLTLQSAPAMPLTAFTGTPLWGAAPLDVQFTDQSSGSPSSWQWSFGDASGSSVSNPEHTYTEPGYYPVSLVTSNDNGSNTFTRFVRVLAPTPRVQTFHPNADAAVSEADPASNEGQTEILRARSAVDGSFQSFLRFDLGELSGTPISARLRLFVTDESNSGGSLYLAPSTWSESDLVWSNKPALPLNPIATAGAATLGTWVELDVSPAILGPGTVSFALAGSTANAVLYASREGANPPELEVQTELGTVREKP